MKVIHVAFECAPMYKTGGLGDVVGSLPRVLVDEGIETHVVMPAYGWIRPLNYLPFSKVPIHYIPNRWFNRSKPITDKAIAAAAYAHFCQTVLKTLEEKKIAPDIIHCHDWHAALIPLLLKKGNWPFFAKTKTILTIHNTAYQGNFMREFFEHPETQFLLELLPRNKHISFLEQGIIEADYVTTVSPHHAEEILKGEVNFGLTTAIKKRKDTFTGILNGIDYSVWNPATDPFILHKYDASTADVGKVKNKYALQKQLGLLISDRLPLYAFIARLSSQKGVDLLVPLLETFSRSFQLVVLGTGDEKYEAVLKKYTAAKYRDFLSINLTFDEKLAHRIYAGADFFLMPSHYEPCGLTQMISFAYGTIPIATQVGGLTDTILDSKTGFLFTKLSSETLWETIETAHGVWLRPQEFSKMITRVFKEDFSWKKSASKYAALYRKLVA